MDSVSQFALGAAIGVACMGRRTALWKAALWGGVCGTLPDLDVLIEHGDPISDMTLHRTESHALFWLTLFSALPAALANRLHGPGQFRRWWLALWLALVTHPLLDAMTVYGTQLLLPFSDHPVGVGSVFIIDPLYTLPLLVGVAVALTLRNTRGLRWNAGGLVLSSAYLLWGVLAQQHVTGIARAALSAQGLAPQRLLVTPAPFTTLLWRVVAVMPDGRYLEGFHALLDASPDVHFDAFTRGAALEPALQALPPVARMAWFSRGFYRLDEQDGELRIADLRMGQEPAYLFTFVVARRTPQGGIEPVVPRQIGLRPDVERALPWLMRRITGEPLPPPR